MDETGAVVDDEDIGTRRGQGVEGEDWADEEGEGRRELWSGGEQKKSERRQEV
jgi:hypothetical protein